MFPHTQLKKDARNSEREDSHAQNTGKYDSEGDHCEINKENSADIPATAPIQPHTLETLERKAEEVLAEYQAEYEQFNVALANVNRLLAQLSDRMHGRGQ